MAKIASVVVLLALATVVCGEFPSTFSLNAVIGQVRRTTSKIAGPPDVELGR